MQPVLARLAAALAFLGFALWLALGTGLAAASSCGGKGERACCVLERVPSCDKGLAESGKCTKNCDCGKGPGKSIGMCVKDDDGPSACGGAGQRACCVTERVPSCNKGLVERSGCKGNACRCGGFNVAGLRSAGTCYKPADCGGNGEKPCMLDVQISEGRASCDKGLAEDFIANRCVEDSAAIREAQCRVVVGALQAGQLPDAFKPFVDEAKKRVPRLPRADALAKATAYVQPLKPIVPELQRIYTELGKTKDLFRPDTLCSPARLQARLKELSAKLEPVVKSVLPTYSSKFHMAYTLNASVAAGPGIAAGYALATDYEGGVGVYVYLGPAVVFNASLGDSIGVQFYPKVTLDGFEGWGFGFGVAAGPPSLIFSGGADVAFTDRGVPVGIGISGGIGLGVLPVDVGVSATHAWKLWSSR
ncbi:MAG: hypothetical protein JNN03_09805 [Rubrivivax sp.]|nr:hypothetical protein [Rubrivivax sp.]